MRLRSLTKHIREQNWFAVALDFFIVVVGILIAFQITNWNEGRKTAEQQDLVEARLINDFKIIDQSLEAAISQHASLIRDLGTLRDNLDDGQADPKDDAAIKRTLVRMRTFPTYILQSSTYEELASSGTLGLIRNDALRDAIAQYDEQAGNRLFNIEQIRSSMQQVFINAAEYAQYEPLDRDNIKIRPIASYDLKRMSEDKAFTQRLEYTLTMQTYIYDNLTLQRNEVDAVLQIMGLK